MKAALIFLFALALPLALRAQEASGISGEAETNWPGIHFQIFALQRIPPDRLLVGVRLIATSEAPMSGTLIGYPVPIPAKANQYDVMAGLYHPRPFSLAASVMTDEKSKVSYPTLSPVAPAGRKYIPEEALTSLRPGQNVIFTIQFAIPPPPPVPPGATEAPGQTVSFLFTNAKAPIMHVTLPALSQEPAP